MRTEEEIRADLDDRRPFSNGSEFDMWAGDYCYNECAHDDANKEIYCPVLNAALLGPDGDGRRTGWPVEWTRKYLKFGPPVAGTTRREVTPTTADDPAGCLFVDTCTEYRRRPDPGDAPAEPDPPPVCDGQLDIIDAYLPTAIEELTPRPVYGGVDVNQPTYRGKVTS